MSHKGFRNKHTKVKTAKGRKPSSTRWLQRQLNDPYVARSKIEGYRSRAAFKLLELDDKFKFLQKDKWVVDLGSTPGGWTQVAVERVGEDKVIALDLQPMEPVPGAHFIEGDFLENEVAEQLETYLEGNKIDVVLSDMAASSSGHQATDHLRIMGLCEAALDFAIRNLAKDGCFIAKVLRGGAEHDLLNLLNQHFTKVRHFKPPASRKESTEIYVVALGFKDN